MITYRRTNYDWQFIFIGPPHSTDYGLRIGVQRSNIVEFDCDPEAFKLLMHRLSNSVRAYQLGDRKYALKLKNPGSSLFCVGNIRTRVDPERFAAVNQSRHNSLRSAFGTYSVSRLTFAIRSE